MLARPELNQASVIGPSKFKWWKDWRGQCVAIIASGPSVSKEEVQKLRDRIHVIVINENWQLAPWADVLYGCDGPWWELRRGVPDFHGLKITQDAAVCAKFPELKKVEVERRCGDILLDSPGYLGAGAARDRGGGHSGFQALNIAVQFGVNGILLVGFDLCGEHWHGRHPPPLNNPLEDNFERWRETFDGSAKKLQSLGIEVINCSLKSTLRAYPKMTIESAMTRWGL